MEDSTQFVMSQLIRSEDETPQQTGLSHFVQTLPIERLQNCGFQLAYEKAFAFLTRFLSRSHRRERAHPADQSTQISASERDASSLF